MSAASKAADAVESPAGKASVCLFSKPLGGRPVAELPALLGDLRCSALDLTCRPGGHVLPERVADDLPRAHEELKAAGVRILMLTTAITDARKDHAEAIIRTAASLDIHFLKLGYYPYRDLGQIRATLREVRAKLSDLAALAREHRVQLGFHNHSGLLVGSPVWDLHGLLAELPPEAIGSYFDAAHATVEGGNGGWQIGLHLLAPRIIMLSVKDFFWESDGQGGWKDRWGPLGRGMVQWKKVLTHLKAARFTGPVSLHVEYVKPAPAGSDAEKAVLAAISRDWSTAQALLAGSGL
jgi:sugar phosphate isomerase/epimerase